MTEFPLYRTMAITTRHMTVWLCMFHYFQTRGLTFEALERITLGMSSYVSRKNFLLKLRWENYTQYNTSFSDIFFSFARIRLSWSNFLHCCLRDIITTKIIDIITIFIIILAITSLPRVSELSTMSPSHLVFVVVVVVIKLISIALKAFPKNQILPSNRIA